MVKFDLKKVNTKTTMHVCIIMYAVAVVSKVSSSTSCYATVNHSILQGSYSVA